ncbi:50S ribosomal protein L13 [uncultured archaeon]|nr:50S ribosomal protein L13 [uncultured archaeon]
MKLINAEDSVVGRIASFAAKEALKGEEVVIINCEKAIISGNKKDLKQEVLNKRNKVGTLQVGPKVSLSVEKYFKRIIRGMLPDHRTGRGREAFKRILCYKGIPEKYKSEKALEIFKESKIKYMTLSELTK